MSDLKKILSMLDVPVVIKRVGAFLLPTSLGVVERRDSGETELETELKTRHSTEDGKDAVKAVMLTLLFFSLVSSSVRRMRCWLESHRHQSSAFKPMSLRLFRCRTLSREGLSLYFKKENTSSLSVSLRSTYTRTASSHNKKALVECWERIA